MSLNQLKKEMRDVVNPWMDEVVGWRPSARPYVLKTAPQRCLDPDPVFTKKSFKNLRVFFSISLQSNP